MTSNSNIHNFYFRNNIIVYNYYVHEKLQKITLFQRLIVIRPIEYDKGKLYFGGGIC